MGQSGSDGEGENSVLSEESPDGRLDRNHSYWENVREGKLEREKKVSESKRGEEECFEEERRRDGKNGMVMKAMMEAKKTRAAFLFMGS